MKKKKREKKRKHLQLYSPKVLSFFNTMEYTGI